MGPPGGRERSKSPAFARLKTCESACVSLDLDPD